MRDVKSYPVHLGVADGMPRGLFDPQWQDPAVAARVAFMIYCRVPFHSLGDAALDDRAVDAPHGLSDARSFRLDHTHTLDDGTRFKGGSYGELHRRYAYGTHTANFHAQAVSFGADSLGRFTLTAVVGRFDGPWGNQGTLAVSFFAKASSSSSSPEVLVGTASWVKALDPTGDHRVVVVGADPRLAHAFDRLTRADVAFVARTGVTSAPDASAPKLSRAKRAVLEAALARARAEVDVVEIARIERLLQS